MPYNNNLPVYPCDTDIWEKLKNEKRPIVVYGMGNGADKLIERFNKYEIEIADFFASDGFVRGHHFHGKRVKSFSEIKAEYEDFVIILSFASNKSDVIEMLKEMSENYEMYIPDMPIANTEEYFDKDFYNAHYNEILEARDALCDEHSKDLFDAIVSYKISAKPEYLFKYTSTKDELYSILPKDTIESYVDVGAYRGDTLAEALHYFKNMKKAVAIEPDPKTFKKLRSFVETIKNVKICAHNAASWSFDGEGNFSESANRNSTVNATASYQHNERVVPFVKLDSIVDGKVDFIKYDVEGAECEALLGSKRLISEYRPSLLISLYHRSSDLFSIINHMKNEYTGYRFYLRRLPCLPAWELDLIMIPE